MGGGKKKITVADFRGNTPAKDVCKAGKKSIPFLARGEGREAISLLRNPEHLKIYPRRRGGGERREGEKVFP